MPLRSDNTEIQIVEYEAKYQPFFRAVNAAWIEKDFFLEEIDIQTLDDPGKYILQDGGAILIALYNGEAAGSCALVKKSVDTYQMIKMAVDEKFRGKHIGDALGKAIIAKGRALGAHRMELYSNTKGSAAAVNLYRKLGFKEIPLDTQEFKRANIKMELPILQFPGSLELPPVKLRPLGIPDAEDLFKTYSTDPEVTRFLRWTPHTTIEQTREFLKDRTTKNGTQFYWAITANGSDRALGMIGARLQESDVNLGFGLSKAFWGKGFMKAAVNAVCTWAFGQLQIMRVTASCDKENAGSQRVLEKTGFRRDESVVRMSVRPTIGPEPRPIHFYVKTR